MLGKERCSVYQIWRAWRLYSMYKETMGFVKGLGTGILAMTAVAAVGSKMVKSDKRLRKSVNKAKHAVGQAAGTMMGSMENLFR